MHPKDLCECGDYRRDHPNDGACSLNGLGHGIPDESNKCRVFRLEAEYAELAEVLERPAERKAEAEK